MYTNIIDLLRSAKNKYNEQIIYRDLSGSDYQHLPKELSFNGLYQIAQSIGTGLLRRIAPSSDALNPQPIAVFTGRHVYTPACFLGIAATGNFYAPIDGEVPDLRIIQLLSVAKAKYIIVDRGTKDRLQTILNGLPADGEPYSPEVLLLEDLANTPADEELLAEASQRISESSPLYMLFTSGSTGVPKGVLTSHLSLMCYLDGLNEVINLESSDVLGNQAPLDYIAAVRDMYLPLLTGCSTVIIPRNIVAMPTELFDVLNKHRVTTLCWSASGLEVLSRLGALDGEILPQHIRQIVFSGSVMSVQELSKWHAALPYCTFINQYGPTETTASCTYFIIKDTVNDDTVLPIGKPFKHYKVFLLDEDDRLVALDCCDTARAADCTLKHSADSTEEHSAGSTAERAHTNIGEICVAGPPLAIGYYNNPEQTAKSFIVNPLIKEYEERIYRTGDLGTYDKDGNLLFLGRKDRQIKHMGHRIELSEIEHEASTVDGISESVAMYDSEKSKLYLFYTGTASTKDIALKFRQEMPAYMVPRKIVNLDAMPVLPNGKLNMPALKELMH